MFVGAVVVFDTFATGSSSDALLEINCNTSTMKGGGSIVDRAVLTSSSYAILKGNIITDVQVGSLVKSNGFAFSGANKTNASIFGSESIFFFGYYVP